MIVSDREFAENLARSAGQLLMEYYHNGGLNTRTKADKSVVTEADLASDRFISEELRKNYPADVLLSEELQPVFPAGARDRAVWVIDPLDGTTNFSLGLHIWGVLLARLQNGWPETAVLYFPLVNELYVAQKNEGAFLNGDRIHVKPPDPVLPAAFFSCCSRTFRRYQVSVPYKARILGSSAYSFCALSRGAAVLSFETVPKIWDIAGAWLLVQEAGGVIETYDGSSPFPLTPGKDYTTPVYPALGAPTRELLAKARQQIVPK
jgi:myo-inositol-1(or 4)-monophosphatase